MEGRKTIGGNEGREGKEERVMEGREGRVMEGRKGRKSNGRKSNEGKEE